MFNNTKSAWLQIANNENMEHKKKSEQKLVRCLNGIDGEKLVEVGASSDASLEMRASLLVGWVSG